MDTVAYKSGFNNITNSEWMWGSRQIDDHSTFFYSYFSSIGSNFNSTFTRTQPKAINGTLWEAIPQKDVRKRMWDKTGVNVPIPPGGFIAPYQSQKFLAASATSSNGNVPYMRAAEMYLIEAEARARQGQDIPARAALFTLVKRRNPDYTLSANSGLVLIEEIMFNRRIELWGEGFRFTDLKRTNSPLNRNGIPNHNPSIAIIFDVPAGDVRWEWLFHQDEINTNKALVQNPL